MSSNNVINQQASLPVLHKVASKAKIKDPERQRRGKKSREAYMKKLKDRFLKDNRLVQMTLKEFMDYFQQDLNDPASILTAIEETIRIMKEEPNTEINISTGKI